PVIAATLAVHQSSGSCSAQPGRGVLSVRAAVADTTTSPDGRTRIALTPLVPTSRPRNTPSATLADSEQDLHRELVEPLVRVTGVPHRGDIECLRLQRGGAFGCEPHRLPTCPIAARTELVEYLLNLGVG